MGEAGVIKTERYRRIRAELVELLTRTADPVARMATIAAVLHHRLLDCSWTGWYLLRDGELTVGPYQGLLACQVLPAHTGVCSAAVDRGETVIVPDVSAMPGHVAGDARSGAELAVPVRDAGGVVVGVLTLTSMRPGHFDFTDRAGLEAVVELVYRAGLDRVAGSGR